MKRIFTILFFILIFTSNSFAVFFADGFGLYTDTGDLKSQMGVGAGFGFDINSNFNFLFRAAYSGKTEDPNTDNEIEYDHMTVLAGIEFIPSLPAMKNYRLSWKTSFLAGMSGSEAEPSNSSLGDGVSDSGFACALWTGIQYDFTQVISPFLDLGYHYSYYKNDLDDASVKGFQVALGVRFYLTGSRDYAGEYQ